MTLSQVETSHLDANPTTGELPEAPQVVPLWPAMVSALLVTAGFAWFHLPNLMGNGLQTDELLTAWVTSDGLGDTISRAQRFQGQSAVYFVFLWFWRQLFGSSEIMLRLPSLLGILAACGLAVRFGRELGSRFIGVTAAIFLLSGSSLMFAATTARPYGFIPLFALISTRGLWHWMRTGKLGYGLQWSLGLALGVAMTPFAAALAPAHLFALWDHRHHEGTLPRGIVLYGALAGLLVLPIVPQVLALSDRRETLVLMPTPSLFDLTRTSLPWALLVICLMLGALVGFIKKPTLADRRIRLFTAWTVVPPLLLYLAGLAGNSPVFLDRYRSVAVLGAGFLLAVVVHHLKPKGQTVALLLTTALTLVSFTQSHADHLYGWQTVTEWLNTNSSVDEDRILAFNPGLVEAYQVEYLSDPTWVPYLTAAIDYYPIDAPRVVVSMELPEADIMALWLDELLQHDTILVMDQLIPHVWGPTIREAALAQGYTEFPGPEVARGTATIFRKGPTN